MTLLIEQQEINYISLPGTMVSAHVQHFIMALAALRQRVQHGQQTKEIMMFIYNQGVGNMLRKHGYRRGVSTVEYIATISIVIAAFSLFGHYFKRALGDRWRSTGEIFGYGRAASSRTGGPGTGIVWE